MDLSISADRPDASETRGWPFAVSSGILGWVLDAFDFFVVIFLFDTLAAHFHVTKAAIVYTLALTLSMRPIGALLFGSLADRFGRRKPLIICVLFFSTITVLSGFSPSYAFFVAMRALYGVGMGGYWGVGASYAMENTPLRWRGILSGVMQAGYPLGYLLAAVSMQVVAPVLGWRAMFVVGSVVTALIVVFTVFAPESVSWKRHSPPSISNIFRTLFRHLRIFLYLLLVMAVMSCLSHGTQDLYPDFLKSVPGLAHQTLFGMNVLFGLPVLYNIGAVLSALFFGHLSETIGRRRAIMIALIVSMLSIPAWAFGTSLLALAIGSYFMQTGVQGAFGVIPAHLNELSPGTIRSLFPGLVYQLGVLIASPAVSVEYLLRNHVGYPLALSLFEACVILVLLIAFALGPERRGRDFRYADARS
jgi:SHS family lactate transporter-like MFS transporter